MQRRPRVIVTPVGEHASVPTSWAARTLREEGLEVVLVPAGSVEALAVAAAHEDADAVVLAAPTVATGRALADPLIAALIRLGSDASLAVHGDDEPIDPALLSELLDARLLESSIP